MQSTICFFVFLFVLGAVGPEICDFGRFPARPGVWERPRPRPRSIGTNCQPGTPIPRPWEIVMSPCPSRETLLLLQCRLHKIFVFGHVPHHDGEKLESSFVNSLKVDPIVAPDGSRLHGVLKLGSGRWILGRPEPCGRASWRRPSPKIASDCEVADLSIADLSRVDCWPPGGPVWPGSMRNSKISGPRPKAGRRADFEVFQIRIRPKSGLEAHFPARKHYCVR